jgi:hypothetical protein
VDYPPYGKPAVLHEPINKKFLKNPLDFADQRLALVSRLTGSGLVAPEFDMTKEVSRTDGTRKIWEAPFQNPIKGVAPRAVSKPDDCRTPIHLLPCENFRMAVM